MLSTHPRFCRTMRCCTGKCAFAQSTPSWDLGASKQGFLQPLDNRRQCVRQRVRLHDRRQCISSCATALDTSSSRSGEAQPGHEDARVQLLALSDTWVAVNKASGILVHRTKLYHTEPGEKFLVDEVAHEVEQRLGRPVKILPVQRLDRPTSGVILFALENSQNASTLQNVLQSAESRKEYWALTFGSDMPEKWVNEHPLRDLTGKNRKQRPAYSAFEQLLRLNQSDLSVVRARIATGRRHQIRRHLSNSRYPVVGDTSHGKGEQNRMARERFGVNRCCLHSRRVAFQDPVSRDQIEIEASVPQDLRDVLESLPDYHAEVHSKQIDLEAH